MKFRKNHEYLDNYCYAQLLKEILSGRERKTQIQLFSKKMDVFLGESDPRAAVCRALSNRDKVAFKSAIRKFLEQKSQEILQENESSSVCEPASQALLYVDVETVALVRLARARGIFNSVQLQRCPASALKKMIEPYPDDDGGSDRGRY